MSVLITIGLCVIAFALYREARGRLGRRRSDRARGPAIGRGRTARDQAALTKRIEDPRESASILLVQQALYEERLTPEHKALIVTLMSSVFGSDQAEAEGLFSFGRAAVGQIGDAADAAGRVLRPVRDRCTLAEMKDLVAMLERVGETGGSMNERQRNLVAAVRRNLRVGEGVPSRT